MRLLPAGLTTRLTGAPVVPVADGAATFLPPRSSRQAPGGSPPPSRQSGPVGVGTRSVQLGGWIGRRSFREVYHGRRRSEPKFNALENCSTTLAGDGT